MTLSESKSVNIISGSAVFMNAEIPIVSKEGGKTKDERWVHEENAYLSIVVSFDPS